MARSIFEDKKISVFSGPLFNKARQINGLLVPVNYWKVVVLYNKGNTGIAAMGFIMSQEKYFNRLSSTRALEAEKMVQPGLTRESILRLYAKKELMDAKVKISMIEEKTSIRFGLAAVDEKKNEREGHVELVSVGQSGMEKARIMEVGDEDEVEVFLGGFEGEIPWLPLLKRKSR